MENRNDPCENHSWSLSGTSSLADIFDSVRNFTTVDQPLPPVDMECERLFAESDDDVEVVPSISGGSSGVEGSLKPPIQRVPCNLSTPADAAPTYQFGMSVQPAHDQFPFSAAADSTRVFIQPSGEQATGQSLDYMVLRNDHPVIYPSHPVSHHGNRRLGVNDVNVRYQPKSDAHYFPPINLNEFVPQGADSTNFTERAFMHADGPDPFMNQPPRRNRSRIEYEAFPSGDRHRVHPLPYHNENILNLSCNSRLGETARDYSGPSNYTNYINRSDETNPFLNSVSQNNHPPVPPREDHSAWIEVSSGEEDNNMTPRKRLLCENYKKSLPRNRPKKSGRNNSEQCPIAGSSNMNIKTEDENVGDNISHKSVKVKQEGNQSRPNHCRLKWKSNSQKCLHNANSTVGCSERPCKCQTCFPSLPSLEPSWRGSHSATTSNVPSPHQCLSAVKQEHCSSNRKVCKRENGPSHHATCTQKENSDSGASESLSLNKTTHRNNTSSTITDAVAGTSRQAAVGPLFCPNQDNNDCIDARIINESVNDCSNSSGIANDTSTNLTHPDKIKIEISEETQPSVVVKKELSATVKTETPSRTNPADGFCRNCQEPAYNLAGPSTSAEVKTEVVHDCALDTSESMEVDVKVEADTSSEMVTSSQTINNEEIKQEKIETCQSWPELPEEPVNSSVMEATPGTSRMPDSSFTCSRSCCETPPAIKSSPSDSSNNVLSAPDLQLDCFSDSLSDSSSDDDVVQVLDEPKIYRKQHTMEPPIKT